jgi:hypothetical protein
MAILSLYARKSLQGPLGQLGSFWASHFVQGLCRTSDMNWRILKVWYAQVMTQNIAKYSWEHVLVRVDGVQFILQEYPKLLSQEHCVHHQSQVIWLAESPVHVMLYTFLPGIWAFRWLKSFGYPCNDMISLRSQPGWICSLCSAPPLVLL